MKGPQLIVVLIALSAALLLAEKIFVEPPLYSEKLMVWSHTKPSGSSSVGSPPESEGLPTPSHASVGVQSTLTHGVQMDVADSKSAEQAWIEAQQISQREFVEFLAEVSERLPKRAQVKNLSPQEVHGRPEILKAAAVDLGEIAQRLERDPSLRPAALEFYKDCALDGEVFRSIRALCFNRAQLLSVDLHQDVWDFDPKAIPKDVIELAKKL